LSAPEYIAAKHGQPVNVRWIVTPGLERGFRRERVNYSTDKTGLVVDYQIMDRQIYATAPWPATDWTCDHTESTNDGISLLSEVTCRLTGPPAVDKRALISRAIQVVDCKLKILDKLDVASFIFENAAIIDHVYEPVVEANIRIRRVPPNKEDGDDPHRLYLADLRANTLGQPISGLTRLDGEPRDYDPAVSYIPPLYGWTPDGERSAAVCLLLSCFVQYPCRDVHNIAKFEGLPEPGTPQSPGTVPDPPTLHPMPEGSLAKKTSDLPHSDAAKKAVFTFSRFSNIYFCPQNRVQLPIARTSASAKDANFDTCVVLTLAPPVCRRSITVDAERIGGWPELPKPVDSYKDGNLTGYLLDYRVEPQPPTISVDWSGSKKVFRATAHYLYAMNRAPTLTEKLRIGVLPTMAGDVKEPGDGATKASQFEPEKAYTERVGP